MDDKSQKAMNSGKRHYMLTVAVTLAALAIIVSYTFNSFYSIMRRDSITIGEKSVLDQSEKLNSFLLQGMDVLQVTALTVDYMLQEGASLEQIEQFLAHEAKVYSEQIDSSFTGIYGVFNGVYIDSSGWIPDEGFVPQDRPWYIAAAETPGKTAIVSPYVDVKRNKVMISVSHMLSDGESVISLDIFMDKMQEIANEFSLNGEDYGFIIDSNGLIVAHSDDSFNGRNFLADSDMQGTEMNSLVKEITAGSGGAAAVNIDGNDCIAFSVMVQDSWYVVLIANTDDLFLEVRGVLVTSIILALFTLGTVAFFCTANYRNRTKATVYAAQLREYQLTLESRVQEQTEKIRKQSEEVVRMQESVVEGMADMIESRDGSTGQHVRSTKVYANMILQYMYEHNIHSEEVTEDFVKTVTDATVLHDVGKIQISDVILNKPGKLTPEEYEIMKTHAQIGGNAVKSIFGSVANPELARIAEDIACHHHERWDGKGYPDGLSGTDIPLCARVVTIADVFDALVSKRVYKEKVSSDEAFRILKEEAGKQFDPELVEIFCRIRSDVEKYLKNKGT